jgi:hypothetical protein
MLETIILGGGKVDIDVASLKKTIKESKFQIKDEKDFDTIEADLFKKHSTQQKEPAAAKPTDKPPENKPAPDAKEKEKDKGKEKEQTNAPR